MHGETVKKRNIVIGHSENISTEWHTYLTDACKLKQK